MTNAKALALQGLEIAERATPGPWREVERGVIGSDEVYTVVCDRTGSLSNPTVVADMALIAFSGTHLSTLCRRVIELEEENEKIKRDGWKAFGVATEDFATIQGWSRPGLYETARLAALEQALENKTIRVQLAEFKARAIAACQDVANKHMSAVAQECVEAVRGL